MRRPPVLQRVRSPPGPRRGVRGCHSQVDRMSSVGGTLSHQRGRRDEPGFLLRGQCGAGQPPGGGGCSGRGWGPRVQRGMREPHVAGRPVPDDPGRTGPVGPRRRRQRAAVPGLPPRRRAALAGGHLPVSSTSSATVTRTRSRRECDPRWPGSSNGRMPAPATPVWVRDVGTSGARGLFLPTIESQPERGTGHERE